MTSAITVKKAMGPGADSEACGLGREFEERVKDFGLTQRQKS